MPQYILKYPIDGKIYYSDNVKKAAKKAFLDLCKYNKYDQSRITIVDNDSKKEYKFIGMTNDKLNEYSKAIQLNNPIQIGGQPDGRENRQVDNRPVGNRDNRQVDNRDLQKISGNLNLTVDELTRMLKQKNEPNKELIFLLENIERNVDFIARSKNRGPQRMPYNQGYNRVSPRFSPRYNQGMYNSPMMSPMSPMMGSPYMRRSPMMGSPMMGSPYMRRSPYGQRSWFNSPYGYRQTCSLM